MALSLLLQESQKAPLEAFGEYTTLLASKGSKDTVTQGREEGCDLSSYVKPVYKGR